MPSSHLILCRPLLLWPPIPPSIRVFSNESTLRMRWPKYWSFSFSIIPSKEIPGLISFRMDWLDLLAVNSMLMKVWHTFIPELTSALTLLQSVMDWDSLLLLELTKHDLRNLCTWCSLLSLAPSFLSDLYSTPTLSKKTSLIHYVKYYHVNK